MGPSRAHRRSRLSDRHRSRRGGNWAYPRARYNAEGIHSGGRGILRRYRPRHRSIRKCRPGSCNLADSGQHWRGGRPIGCFYRRQGRPGNAERKEKRVKEKNKRKKKRIRGGKKKKKKKKKK